MKPMLVGVHLLLGVLLMYGAVTTINLNYQVANGTFSGPSSQEARNAIDNLSSLNAPYYLLILLGIISAVSAVGFWRLKKWSAVGVVVSSFVALGLALYWSLAILMSFGELSTLLLPVAAAIWIVIEISYIKRNWLSFS